MGFNPLPAADTTTPAVPETVHEEVSVVPSQTNKNKDESAGKKMTIEQYVRDYFSDAPVMAEIAKCESRFRQYDENGEVLRGEKNSLDRGVMQINEYYHNESSEKLGYDIMTLEGNTAYARHLFEKYGVQPWISSSKCWKKTTAYSDYIESLNSTKELAMS